MIFEWKLRHFGLFNQSQTFGWLSKLTRSILQYGIVTHYQTYIKKLNRGGKGVEVLSVMLKRVMQ